MNKIISFGVFVLLTFNICAQEIEMFEEVYPNGQIKLLGELLDDKKNGEWKEYYETGEILKVSNYKEGKFLDSKSYYKNGTLRSESEKVGEEILFKSYYETGELFEERIMFNGYFKEFNKTGVLRVKSNYEDGCLSGTWIQFYDTGEKEWEVNYIDGYKEGNYVHYYKNGKVKEEGSLSDNLKEGKEKRYNEQGFLVWEGYYQKDTLSKKWKKYNSLGKKIKSVKYVNGQTIDNEEELISTNIPNGVISTAVIHPECIELIGNKAIKKCTSEKITRHISRKFNTDLAGDLQLVGRQKVIVNFEIDEQGYVIGVRAKAPHPDLEDEAIRVVELLPQFKPGTKRGKPMELAFSIPVIFQIVN